MRLIKLSLLPLLVVLALLAGCSSIFNPGGSSEYSCPGMPNGVVCKTPAAVYRSTHGDVEQSEYDAPIAQTTQAGSGMEQGASTAQQARPVLTITPLGGSKEPLPLRNPASVSCVWIASWVDKDDRLYLAQVVCSEVKARTWALGSTVGPGGGRQVPYRAFTPVEAASAGKPSTPKK